MPAPAHLNFIDSLGNGDSFTVAGVNDDFFNGTSARYPIPFVNVMIGTFMLDALRGACGRARRARAASSSTGRTRWCW